MSKTTTAKNQKQGSKTSNSKTKQLISKKKIVKSTKQEDQMAYFWGGLGIVLCATAALIILLWGVGAMLQR